MIRQNFILRDFIREMKTMTGEGYQKTVMDWFELSCDVCEDTPAQLGNELEDVLRSLLFVKHNFRPEVLQKSLTTLVLPNEVIYGAMLFDNSVDRETVLNLAANGALECGYIPDSRDERGTLTLIRIEDPSPRLLMAADEAPERIENILRWAALDEKEQGRSAADFLTNRLKSHVWIYDLSSGPLCAAAMKTFLTSTAVGRLYTYSTHTHTFTKTDNVLMQQETADTTLDESFEDDTMTQIYDFVELQVREDIADLQDGKWERLSWQALYNLHEEAVRYLEFLNQRKNLSARDYDCRDALRNILQAASDAISEKSREVTGGYGQTVPSILLER